MARRNRIIYQSKALFIAPNATGAQIALSGALTNDAIKQRTGVAIAGTPETYYSNADLIAGGTGLSYKLDRVQNLDFGFTINAQDINEMGKLTRINRISNEPPTVNLNYSYYITDGLNERLMGFVFGGTDDGTTDGAPYWDTPQNPKGAGAFSGFLEETQGQNYYIVTSDEGEDVVGMSITPDSDGVIAIGNGFLSSYELNLTVGEIPTANVSVEGFNIRTDIAGTVSGFSGVNPSPDLSSTPATNFDDSTFKYKNQYLLNSGLFSAQVGSGASEITALRPGDITLSSDAQVAGDDEFVVFDEATADANTIQIQSCNFSLPLARTVLNRLGTFFGYNRIINVPLDMEVTISAFATQLRDNKNLFNLLCGAQNTRDFTVNLNSCDAAGNISPAISYKFKGAILTSENHSLDIGGNETVDLTYSIQIGGANDTLNGLFMSGSYSGGYNAYLESGYAPTTDLTNGKADAEDLTSGFANLVSGFFGQGTQRNY